MGGGRGRGGGVEDDGGGREGVEETEEEEEEESLCLCDLHRDICPFLPVGGWVDRLKKNCPSSIYR